MIKELFRKTKESIISIFPIFILVMVLNFTIVPLPKEMMGAFFIGTLFLMIGMSLFTLGADNAMMPMGTKVGAFLSKHKKLGLLIISTFLMGTFITIAEPDLKVLAQQASYLPSTALILTVSVGVGLFLVLSVLRVVFKLSLSKLLIISYSIVFVLTIFIPEKFIPLSYDSGGVTTGPITVPFIMAFGIGIASVSGGEETKNDSFGLIGLCSVGPILSVLLLSLFFKNGNTMYVLNDANFNLVNYFFVYAKEIAIALLPIVVLFFIFQIFFLKMPKKPLIKIIISIVYTFLGLLLFLVGVNYGFMNVGTYIGKSIIENGYKDILIPLGMLMGLLTILAEPAVYVLNKQVEEISSGLISKKSLTLSLAIGVSIAVGLAMTRIVFDIPIYYIIIPGYLLAILLTFFTPKLFIAIAFDSGGVASGPMAATFILPFAIGACLSLNHSVILDAFGLVSLIALTPLIAIQILGIIYQLKLNKQVSSDTKREVERYIELEV